MKRTAMGAVLAGCLTAAACGNDGDDDGVPGRDGAPDPDSSIDGGTAPDASPTLDPEWTPTYSLPEPRQEHAVVNLGGYIYVLGGIDGSLTTLTDVRRLDHNLDGGWFEAVPLPLPVHHLNAAVVGDRIYVVGSLLADFEPIGDVWSWAVGEDEWSTGASMPPGSERGAAAVGVVDGRILIAGGLDGTSSDLVSAYDPATDEWDVELPALPARIDHGTGQVVDGVFYVIGGRTDGTDGNSSAVWALVDGAWEERAAMPTARGGIAGGVLDGKIIVVGGEGNDDDPDGVFAEVELYDPATDQWSALPDMPEPRHGMGAAAAGGLLYVPGGADREAFGAVDTADRLTLR